MNDQELKDFVERIRTALHYDPDTGIFTRKQRTAQRHQVGDRACGNPIKGTQHFRVAIFGTKYLAHRLAWLYVYGKWPDHHIDHINGNMQDNRIVNLRDVPNRINRQNMRNPKGENTSSGLLGVYLHTNGSWVARIQLNGKGYYLGSFEDKYEAQQAYLEAKRRMHEGCTI